MSVIDASLLRDIEKIKQIDIIPMMLEVICRATGMGFAAIARVTDERWVACSVRDEIGFGLEPGGELPLKTTICDEIRQSRQPVVIDNVANDPDYCNHHTPSTYKLQSYISMPIILNNGAFFGTLCAIDPNPAHVSDLKITGMFTLFAQLIALHLQTMDTLEKTSAVMATTSRDLADAQDENRLYEHITYHRLREPARKISLYSDLLCQSDHLNPAMIRERAAAIKRCAGELTKQLRQLSTEPVL